VPRVALCTGPHPARQSAAALTEDNLGHAADVPEADTVRNLGILDRTSENGVYFRWRIRRMTGSASVLWATASRYLPLIEHQFEKPGLWKGRPGRLQWLHESQW